ncbi:MAG: alpha/beta fold hydrolase [Cyanobacteria bacterium P01_C01_bin.89]
MGSSMDTTASEPEAFKPEASVPAGTNGRSPTPYPKEVVNKHSDNPNLATPRRWRLQTGRWRTWRWRGWQVKYAYLPGTGELSTRPPILAVHGFGASIGHWRNNFDVWGQSGDVFALDLVGFGGSDKPPTDYSGTLWVSQVTAFLDEVVGEAAILVGNSIGSAIAMTVADQCRREGNPRRVAAVIALSLPDTAARAEMIPALLLPMVSFMERVVANPPLLKTIFYWVRRPSVIRKWVGIAYPDKTAIDDDLVEILSDPPQEPGTAEAFVRILRGMSSPTFTPSMKPVLAASNIPVLVLWGSSDAMIPPALARGFEGLNPLVTVRSLDGLGHCPHDEAPKIINPMILNWIAETISSSPASSSAAPVPVP